MNACVFYFSQTGNTQTFAKAIADAFQIPKYNLTTTDPSIVNTYDTIMLGTPVHGFRPAVETLEFISRLPQSEGKQIVLFCSYALWIGRSFSKLENELKKKGFHPILRVKKKMKKGHQWTPTDFADVIDEIHNALTS